MEKYSKRMIIGHWLTLALVVVAFFLGDSLDDARHEGTPALTGYIIHAVVGLSVLALILARLFFRHQDGTPPALGQSLMDKVAKGIHHALYTLLVLIPVSGFLTIATSDIRKAFLAHDDRLLPKKLEGVTAHGVHELLLTVMLVLIAIHLLGALKHQFVLKDNIMGRMSLRKKN